MITFKVTRTVVSICEVETEDPNYLDYCIEEELDPELCESAELYAKHVLTDMDFDEQEEDYTVEEWW